MAGRIGSEKPLDRRANFEDTAGLLDCLRFDGSRDRVLLDRFGKDRRGALDRIFAVGMTHGLLAAALDRLVARGVINADDAVRDAGAGIDIVHQYTTALSYRQQSQRARLIELAGALNSCNIEPLLTSCSQAIWQGEPAWVHARGLAVNVPAPQWPAAKLALQDTGYRQVPPLDRMQGQGETHWFRPELSGWIALRAPEPRRAMRGWLAGEELWHMTTPAVAEHARVRLLPPHLSVLHAIVYDGHAGAWFGHGKIRLKPLYAFAWRVSQMSATERTALLRRANGTAKLKSLLDHWLCAADDCFSMLPLQAIDLSAGARQQWARHKSRMMDLSGL